MLNALHILHLYNRLKDEPDLDITPRTFIFGAKAFPNYHLAKKIIKLINTIAAVVNSDRRTRDILKVIFMENYRVSWLNGSFLPPNVSEQISTAGKEASGTGNMKFMLNGAITIGTLDGANVEIMKAVGRENIFIFGLTAIEVMRYYQNGGYNARTFYTADPRLHRIVDQLIDGSLRVPASEFSLIHDHLLLHNDEFSCCMTLLRMPPQEAVQEAYHDRRRWLAMSIRNIAQAGRFSSDRTISEYASGIWRIKPVVPAAHREQQLLAASLIDKANYILIL